MTQCGMTKLLVKDVPNLVKSIALNSSVLRVKAALDQFMAGLKELHTGVPNNFQGFLCEVGNYLLRCR